MATAPPTIWPGSSVGDVRLAMDGAFETIVIQREVVAASVGFRPSMDMKSRCRSRNDATSAKA